MGEDPVARRTALEEDNRALREQIAVFGVVDVDGEAIEALRLENDRLRGAARPENEAAYVTRLAERRDELAVRVDELRVDLTAREDRAAAAERLAAPIPGRPLARFTIRGRKLDLSMLVVLAGAAAAFFCGFSFAMWGSLRRH